MLQLIKNAVKWALSLFAVKPDVVVVNTISTPQQEAKPKAKKKYYPPKKKAPAKMEPAKSAPAKKQQNKTK